MKRYFIVLWLISITFGNQVPDKVIINHTNWDPSHLHPSILNEVRQQKIIYLHRSIGSNIVAGLMRFKKKDTKRYSLYITHAPVHPRYMDRPGFGHDMFQKLLKNNPNKRSYYDLAAFDSTIRSCDINGQVWGHVIDLAFFNVGWSGIRRHIDVHHFFNKYISTMSSLANDFPDCNIVHFTCPIKGNIEREWQKLDNIACHRFNLLLREYIDTNGGILFDIADIEAHDNHGQPQTFTYHNQHYPKMWYTSENPMHDGWSSDGGHLNSQGQDHLAQALWSLLGHVIINKRNRLGENMNESKYRQAYLLPRYLLRSFVKKKYYRFIYFYNRMCYLKQERMVDVGYRFRFTRNKPYLAYIGKKTFVDDFNVWSAKKGDIIIGKKCWFGLNNIVMGPVEVGDNLLTGPYVTLAGPHHAIYSFSQQKDRKTIIGNNVWISTGSIILFGITIGDNVIIGPGSVITKNVADNSYVAGNPAKDLTQLINFKSMFNQVERV